MSTYGAAHGVLPLAGTSRLLARTEQPVPPRCWRQV
jgi:hypothetical protein